MAKGATIPTQAGNYTPQVNEVWHSDAAFRTLERTLYYPPNTYSSTTTAATVVPVAPTPVVAPIAPPVVIPTK